MIQVAADACVDRDIYSNKFIFVPFISQLQNIVKYIGP